MKFDISVVMITWAATARRMDILKRSLKSLADCTEIEHTLIVVDNGPQEQTEYLKKQNIDVLLHPPHNIGIGAARNLGADADDSEYIAFVDNDILYFPGWLGKCVKCLQETPGKYIATPIKSSPMRKYAQKYKRGMMGPYELWGRASPQAWVMRRNDFKELGLWPTHSQPGTSYCDRLRGCGYGYLWHPSWNAEHLDRHPSYNHREALVDGQWVKRPGHRFWKGCWLKVRRVRQCQPK